MSARHFHVRAADYDEARAIAGDGPTLSHIARIRLPSHEDEGLMMHQKLTRWAKEETEPEWSTTKFYFVFRR